MQEHRLDRETTTMRSDAIEALCVSEPATDGAADFRCCAAADALMSIRGLRRVEPDEHGAGLVAWLDDEAWPASDFVVVSWPR